MFMNRTSLFVLLWALCITPAWSAIITPQPVVLRRVATDKFTIYSSNLLANPQILIASDPTRELNHAHLSPDHMHLLFTRYNLFNSSGVAVETNGYFQTESIICDFNGSNCNVVIPQRPNIIAANATWMPDGSGFLYVTNDTPNGQVGIAHYDLATHMITPYFEPGNISISDPNLVGQQMVVSAIPQGAEESILLLVSQAGVRPLTSPTFANFQILSPLLGDFDSKLSPDGTRVALMRHMSPNGWNIVVKNIASGTETNLSSGPNAVDAVPEWSSDNRLLIFWHVDLANMPQTGIWTMNPDGTGRAQVPLPPGHFYTMATFIPGGGSFINSQIYYSSAAP